MIFIKQPLVKIDGIALKNISLALTEKEWDDLLYENTYMWQIAQLRSEEIQKGELINDGYIKIVLPNKIFYLTPEELWKYLLSDLDLFMKALKRSKK